MRMENISLGLCIICDAPLPPFRMAVCGVCHRPTATTRPEPVDIANGIYEVKSMCCGADLEVMAKTTCSVLCHDRLIKKMIAMYGEFKPVVDAETGKTHKVPMKHIVENGLKHEDIKKFPLWDSPVGHAGGG